MQQQREAQRLERERAERTERERVEREGRAQWEQLSEEQREEINEAVCISVPCRQGDVPQADINPRRIFKFALFDLDKDAHIDYHELKVALKALGFDLPKPEILQILQTHGVPA
ncbi:Calcium-binding component of the spindle pole body (SPB) half-bridge, partial [Cryomyces antarcticus]